MNIKLSIFLLFISVNCFAHHPGNKIDAEKPYPLINLEIIKDKVDGYNLYIDLENFTLNPSQIGIENQPNMGYLQLFVNDIKITRVYSNWVHVPQRFFNLKDNFIKITFNSNLYDEFTIEGKPLEYILKVTGD
jgi:hypothetical protein